MTILTPPQRLLNLGGYGSRAPLESVSCASVPLGKDDRGRTDDGYRVTGTRNATPKPDTFYAKHSIQLT
eukprot:scaffold500641_cov47-Attheya_sp.AAC.1